MKIVTILGARPQFIKASAVSNKIRMKNSEIIIHTGQHYDDNMSRIFFKDLNIPYPDYNLGVGSGSHGMQTAKMIAGIEELLIKENPDLTLLYGDTNSTLAGAIASAKLIIPIAHIEAGPRDFDKRIPEEQNRTVTDHLSKYLFAPTETAVLNLKREGLTENVYNAGNVMYDAFVMFGHIAREKSVFKNDDLGEYILATIHRPCNTDNLQKLKGILEVLGECGKKVIFPIHPRTSKFIEKYGITISGNIHTTKPLGYLDMLYLETNCVKVVTDSGGVQTEAYFAGKPCITLMNTTSWPETLNAGWNILVGCDKDKILSAIEEFNVTGKPPEIFGDGNASGKIVNIIERDFQ